MANLPELDEFTTGVYQLELTDPIEGGPDGVDNYQAKALANRTLWLKNRLATETGRIDTAETDIDALQALVANLEAYIPKKIGWVTGINPGSGTIGDSLTCGGQIASCVLDAKQFQANRYLVTMNAPALASTNYKVVMSSESMSSNANWINDTNFREPLFKKISTTQFYLIVDEDDSGFFQNIKIHFDVRML